MSAIAELRKDADGFTGRLTESERQRSLRVGRDGLLLGYPASPERVPVAELGQPELAALVNGRAGERPSLSGAWAHLDLDPDRGRLSVSTDDFNTRPLFIRSDPSGVAVSDRIWSLLDRGHELDPAGVADFLFVGHHLGSRTAFSSVSSTRAGMNWRWEAGEVTSALTPPPLELSGEDDAEKALDPAMQGLFAPYRDNARLLIELSGGLDSRVLCALAVEAGFDVHAWTFVTRRGSEEERIARRVARELDVPHTVSSADPVTPEGILDLVEATSGHLNLNDAHGYGWSPPPPAQWPLMVNGIYGDLVLGGSYMLSASTPENQIVQARIRRLLRGADARRLQKYLPGVPDWAEEVQEGVASLYSLVGRNPRLSDWTVILDRAGRFNVFGSIAHRSHDYIAPFLDMDLASVCYSLAESRRRDSAAYLEWVCRRWPRLARTPWDKTGLPLDRRIGGLARRWRYVRRRYAIGPPIAFTHPNYWYRRNRPHLVAGAKRVGPTLEAHGIDVGAVLADYRERSLEGKLIRFRLATLDAAIDLSRQRRSEIVAASS